MKVVAVRNCQVKLPSGKIRFLNKGQVVEEDWKEAPAHTVDLDNTEKYEIDFLTATEDELMSAKWKLADVNAVFSEAYNTTIEVEDGDKKSDVVARILDVRYRALDSKPLKMPAE